jgi:uncharacterized protein YegL
VKVKIAYVHTVSCVLNTFYEFRLPITITPRYRLGRLENRMMQDYDEEERRKHKQHSIAGDVAWKLRLRIKSSNKLTHYFSRTHTIKLGAKEVAKDTWEIEFDEKELSPNRDFAICYTFDNFEKPSVLLSQSDNNTRAVVSLVPKFCQLSVNDAVEQARERKEQDVDLSQIKGEYIFLIDRSASMEGSRIRKATDALIVFLKSLPEQSYFNIISFGSNFEALYAKSQKYEQAILKATIDQVKDWTASFGGTEILAPLQDIMKKDIIEDYPRHLFLLTDGAVNDTAAVVTYVTQHCQFSRMHTIGIGDGCSQDIILQCAELSKGYSVFISDEEEPSSKIIDLLERSMSPVITNLKISYNESMVVSVVPNPKKCPFILRNEVANFYFTFNGKLLEPLNITFSYTDSLGQTYTGVANIEPKNADIPYISKMVDFVAINALVAMHKYEESSEDHIYFVKPIDKEQLRKEIIKESVEKQILTDLTVFICVDASEADEVLKAKKKEEKEQVNIGGMNPHDHQGGYEVSFGGYIDDDSDDEYIDECAMQPRLYDPKEIVPPKKIGVKPAAIKLTVIDAREVKTKAVEDKKVEDQIPLMELIAMQEVNGSWSPLFNGKKLLEHVWNADDLKRIR